MADQQQQLFSFMRPPQESRLAVEARGNAKRRPSPRQTPRSPETLQPETPQPETPKPTTPTRETVLKKLRAQAGCIHTTIKDSEDAFSTGSETIDSWLPIGGLHPSTLTEWVAAHHSAAAGSLALLAAANRLRQIPGRPLVIVDCQGSFYPPAAAALGIPHERVILLRPSCRADALWAIDQSLRSGAVAAVWAYLPMQVDDRDARRLQLASETGHTPGLLVRDFAARGKPSFAEVQFYVTQQKRNRSADPIASPHVSAVAHKPSGTHKAAGTKSNLLRRPGRHHFETISVTLDRVRGGLAGRQLDLRIDDQAFIRPLSANTPSRATRQHETAAEHLASQLANPTSATTTSSVDRRFAS